MDKNLALGFKIAQLLIDSDGDNSQNKPIIPEDNKALFELAIDSQGISDAHFADLLER